MINYQKSLKDRSYYEERYDRRTVEDCRITAKVAFKSNKNTKNLPKYNKAYIANFLLYFQTGERYMNRDKTIQEWMDNDRERDERYENTPIPENVMCKFCKKPMELWHKWFRYSPNEKADPIEFIFSCKKCRVGKKIYDNGKTIDIIPWKCPDCSRELKTKESRKGNKIKTIDTCSFCGYKKTNVLDLDEKITDQDPEPTEEEKIQFEKDRDRFCLSHEKGMEYLRFQAGMKRLNDIADEQKKSQLYKKPPKLFNLEQVKKLLIKELKSHGFIQFKIGKFEMKQGMMVNFSVHDEKARNTNKSRLELIKLIKKMLKDTNWRLMTEGISGYLGVLKGRLRGMECNDTFMYGHKGEVIHF